MDFLLQNWLLVLLAMVSGAMLLWPQLGVRGGGSKVSAAQAVQMINREKAVLVDVGEPTEYASGHAAGARNIPLGQIDAAGVKGLPANKALPVVLVCPTGMRAGRAAALLRKQGYEKAVALAGGTRAWTEANLPVEKSAA